ncbi:hypothetical protein V8E51_005893 [Hyaloscypha variabilis]
MRYRYTGPLPPWAPDTSPFRVLDCSYDHFTQKLQTSPAQPWPMPPISLLTMAQVSRQLDAHYRIPQPDGSIIRLAMGAKPENVFKDAGTGGLEDRGAARRTNCDVCFIHNRPDQDVTVDSTTSYSNPPTCNGSEPGVESCPRCMRLNRPCTWTPRLAMIARGWLDLGVSRKLNLWPRAIPSPQSNEALTALEEDQDEDEDDSEA